MTMIEVIATITTTTFILINIIDRMVIIMMEIMVGVISVTVSSVAGPLGTPSLALMRRSFTTLSLTK